MDNLPDDLTGILALVYQYASPYIWPLLGSANTILAFLTTSLLPLLQPSLLWILDTSSQSPALGVVFLLAALFLGFKIMSLTQRALGYLAFLALRLGFWALLVMGVAMVWQRGLERSVSDAVAVGRVVLGRWGEEYQRFNEGSKGAGHRAGGGVGGGKGRWS